MVGYRRTLLILCGLLAGSVLVSCGSSSAQTETGLTETEIAVTTEAATTEEPLQHDNLPDDLDFGGVEIVIHTRGDDDPMREVDAEQTGDVMDDVFYNRNLAVEERLNVVITAFQAEGWANYTRAMKSLEASIMSGDNAYQLVSGWRCNIPTLALDGCFYDLKTVDYLDTAQPWWNQSVAQGCNLCGKEFFATGDISIISLLGGTYALYQNDALAAEYDIADVAEMVRAGTWTLDAFNDVIKGVSKDLNGDGVMNTSDLYGFVTDLTNSADTFYVASGIHQISLDQDGYPVFTSGEERMTELIEKIYPLFHGETDYALQTEAATQEEMFMNGQALFIQREVCETYDTLRPMKESYTLFPYPKLDEAQEEYYTCGFNAAQLWCIPTSNPDSSTAGAVMEAMAWQTWAYVSDVFFETCLQDKLARNETTIEMLDLMKNTIYLDVELVYAPVFNNSYDFARGILAGNGNVSSYYAKHAASVEAAIEKNVQKLQDLQ